MHNMNQTTEKQHKIAFCTGGTAWWCHSWMTFWNSIWCWTRQKISSRLKRRELMSSAGTDRIRQPSRDCMLLSFFWDRSQIDIFACLWLQLLENVQSFWLLSYSKKNHSRMETESVTTFLIHWSFVWKRKLSICVSFHDLRQTGMSLRAQIVFRLGFYGAARTHKAHLIWISNGQSCAIRELMHDFWPKLLQIVWGAIWIHRFGLSNHHDADNKINERDRPAPLKGLHAGKNKYKRKNGIRNKYHAPLSYWTFFWDVDSSVLKQYQSRAVNHDENVKEGLGSGGHPLLLLTHWARH